MRLIFGRSVSIMILIMIALINIVLILVSMEWMQGCTLVWFRLIVIKESR